MATATGGWGFGDALVAARAQRKLTQRQMAEDVLHVSAATLRRWEKNQTMPKHERLIRVCRTLHLRPTLRAAEPREIAEDEIWATLAREHGPERAEKMITSLRREASD
jgi:transcriptional regulator with XRE-family HTH domain